MKRVVLLGGGGHASDVLGVIEALADPDLEVVGILDDGDVDEATFGPRGVTKIGIINDCGSVGATHFVAAAGWPETRKALAERGESAGLIPVSLVHPKAWLGAGVKVGAGAVVLANAAVSPMALLGDHSYVSQLASVGHHAIVGRFSSLMPGAAVSGDVVLGDLVTIGTNAAVIEGVKIGIAATLGAGSTAIRDLAPGKTYVGLPASPVQSAV